MCDFEHLVELPVSGIECIVLLQRNLKLLVTHGASSGHRRTVFNF
jgi:hypothetical protein